MVADSLLILINSYSLDSLSLLENLASKFPKGLRTEGGHPNPQHLQPRQSTSPTGITKKETIK